MGSTESTPIVPIITESSSRQPHVDQTGAIIEVDDWKDLKDLSAMDDVKATMLSNLTPVDMKCVGLILGNLNQTYLEDIGTILFWHGCPRLSVTNLSNPNGKDLLIDLPKFQRLYGLA